ncbi:MAG: hypothetical protein EOP48_23415 [Sphingobacteriales bacterium]|nr:MAG: hypothetical protein EOP48_23415 [Sphingobacteriales bacterium]
MPQGYLFLCLGKEVNRFISAQAVHPNHGVFPLYAAEGASSFLLIEKKQKIKGTISRKNSIISLAGWFKIEMLKAKTLLPRSLSILDTLS